MKFSAWSGSASPWEEILDVSQHVEATGWDGVWVADHFMPNRPDSNLGPTQEAMGLITGLAALVPRVRIGTLVLGNTYRNPAVLAKQIAQADIISGGRIVFGIGAGWQENEHEAYGIEFSTVGGRLRRLEEAVQIIKGLYTQEQTTFEGRYYQMVNAPLDPKPVQNPHPPILIGGGGEKVTLRITAQYADEWNTWGAPDVLAQKGSVLNEHCERLGRDPAEIKHSAQAIVVLSDDPEVVEKARGPGRATIAGNADELKQVMQDYIDAGVDEFIVPDFNLGRTPEAKKESYDRFFTEVASEFRD